MEKKNFISKSLYSYAGTILFFLFFVILFRDFLYTYRLQIEKFFPYYAYQDQIEYYLTGDDSFDIKSPMNLRFLGLFLQFIIYKVIPCIELNNLNIDGYGYKNYVCATFSSALMNYISLCAYLSVTFVYCSRKLNLSLAESFLTVLLSYIYIDHIEAFTLDRISILYLLIIFYFLDNKKISFFLIIFSALVNEKIIFILGGIFFIRIILEKDKKYNLYIVLTIISAMIAILIFYVYSIYLEHGYFQSDQKDGLYDTYFSRGLERITLMFTSKSGLSNALLPLILAIAPYLISLIVKTKKVFYSKFDFLIPISMLAFTAGGGMEQTGRYVMYTMPLWLPIFAQQIIFILDYPQSRKNV
tara:strand:- start:1948 stop:3018 length:1071 start_codon:yes stop_codon:yes gene_type:complete